MKVLFCVNIPSPYRVDFFNELGRHCELTVCFERSSSSERDAKWVSDRAINYTAVFLKLRPFSYDRTVGWGLMQYLRKCDADIIVMANYYSPSAMMALSYLRWSGRPFYMEDDGGFYSEEKGAKRWLKKWLVGGCFKYLTTSEESMKHLEYLGLKRTQIHKYPFSSVKESAISSLEDCQKDKKAAVKRQLGIPEEHVIVAVGQFIYRKGFDILLDAFEKIQSGSIGLYLIGGKPTDHYLEQIKRLKLKHVHFPGFMSRDELSAYYKMADVVAFPTREDIWGLITNETFAYGVPVVATDRCISALEMVENGKNGYVVPVNDSQALAEKLKQVIDTGSEYYARACLQTAHQYSIEAMVEAHLKIWGIKS